MSPQTAHKWFDERGEASFGDEREELEVEVVDEVFEVCIHDDELSVYMLHRRKRTIGEIIEVKEGETSGDCEALIEDDLLESEEDDV